MSLSVFLFFLAGAGCELVLLWEGGRISGSRLVGRFGAPPVNLTRWLVPGLVVLALALRAGLSLFRLDGQMVSLDDTWVSVIFVVLSLFLLVSGVVGDALLPRVDEQAILVSQLLVAFYSLTAGSTLPLLGQALLVGLPLLISLALVIIRKAPPPALAALIYLGYLLSLLALTLESGKMGLFSQAELNEWEGLALGGLFIFLGLHALFAVRFFLIVSSLLVPRNRPLVVPMMARLLSPVQISWRAAILAFLILGGALAINAWQHWAAPDLLVSLAVMGCAQAFKYLPDGTRVNRKVVS